MKRHRGISWFGGLVLAAACAVNGIDAKPAGQDKADNKPMYYPLQAGNEWKFKVTVGENSATAVSRIAKIETIDGKPMSRLEAFVNDKLVATEHLGVTDKGVFRYRNNGQEISPPLCLLKFPAKAGAKWSGDITVGKEKGKYACKTSEENVEVPAGKFKALRVTIRLDSNGQTVTTSYWFVPKIGFVRQTVTAQNLDILMELQKFILAQPEKK